MAHLEAFQVRLGNYRLAKLMPALCEGTHVSGTLMLERGRVRREFTFRDGEMVAGASSSPGEHLSQVLSDLGILDARVAAAAFEDAEARGLPFAQHLVSSGLVSRERLLEALEHKAREGFFDCYTWESGDLWFLPRRAPGQGIELRVNLAALHREAMARLEKRSGLRAPAPAPVEVEAKLNEVREKLAAGQYEQAEEAALRVLCVASVPEAQELYRSAEGHLARLYGKRVAALEGRLAFLPLPSPPPADLTSADLYLYSKLKGAPSLVEALRRSASGELAAARSLFRLIDSGLIAVSSR